MTVVALNHEVATADEAAPPLLLGGSLGTTLLMWDPEVTPLAERFRVIRFDHRGHGGSPVPPGPYTIEELGRDVLRLLDGLGIERASYGGLSLGGMVGMWLAANAPTRIDRLVLMSTAAHLPPASGWIERAAAVRAAGTPAAVADMVVGRWFTPRFAVEEPKVVARYRAMIAATAAEGYAGCCEAIAEMDLRASLPGIAAPTLMIAGADDPSTPPEHARAIAAAIPGARLEVLDDAAHLLSVQHATAVTDLILDHLSPRKEDQ